MVVVVPSVSIFWFPDSQRLDLDWVSCPRISTSNEHLAPSQRVAQSARSEIADANEPRCAIKITTLPGLFTHRAHDLDELLAPNGREFYLDR